MAGSTAGWRAVSTAGTVERGAGMKSIINGACQAIGRRECRPQEPSATMLSLIAATPSFDESSGAPEPSREGVRTRAMDVRSNLSARNTTPIGNFPLNHKETQ